MNSSTRKTTNLKFAAAMFGAAAMVAGALAFSGSDASAAGKSKGVEVEIPYDGTQLKTTNIVAPYFLNEHAGGLIVSDRAGGVYSVAMSGKTTEIAGKAKVKHPGGVAIAPAGFGSYAGQTFVLTTNDAKAPCEVDRIDQSGAVSTFAKLPNVGANAPTDCRDLQFGVGPFAGKLYAATSANSTIYSVDSSGKASVFGTYDKPLAFDLTTIAFAPASDPKAGNMMLVGVRPRMGGAAKIGRINIVTPDGKMKDDPYLVGFIDPTGFGYSPANWGSYGSVFFIADMGKTAEAGGPADGSIYRVSKGVAKPFAGNLADPTCMKFVGNKMVLADPAAKGKTGAIVVISSML